MSHLFDDHDANLFKLINLNLAAYGGGLTGELLLNTFYCKNGRVRDVSVLDSHQSQFFRPLRKRELDRLLTPLTAPIALSLIAVEMALAFAVKLLAVLVAICSLNQEKVIEHFSDAVKFLAFTVVMALAAPLSIILNTIDVVGGAVNACITPDDSVDSDEPRFNFNSSF